MWWRFVVYKCSLVFDVFLSCQGGGLNRYIFIFSNISYCAVLTLYLCNKAYIFNQFVSSIDPLGGSVV